MRGADTVLITGAVQSNLVRLTVAASWLGIYPHIQLEEFVDENGTPYRASSILPLDRVLGVMLHVFLMGEDETTAELHAQTLADEGLRPYVIHSAPRQQ